MNVQFVGLLFGLLAIAGNVLAENKHTDPQPPAAQSAKQARSGEPAAGTVWKEPNTGMAFVWVPSGCFQMGGNDGNSDNPKHQVCVKGLWLGRYEVTQSQYKQVVGSNPSYFSGASNPVEVVNWQEANDFAETMGELSNAKEIGKSSLNKQAGKSPDTDKGSKTAETKAKLSFRLPSEAEWEYACRAGGAHRLYCGFGSNPDVLAWHDSNSGGKTHPVGKLATNNWGLFDMSGNVLEWVQDCWNANYNGAPTDGSAWVSGNCAYRILRNGSWIADSQLSTASFRYGFNPNERQNDTGFRLAATWLP